MDAESRTTTIGQRSVTNYRHKIAVDVATRTICAAVLRPVGTKAVDVALMLAKMLVPEPMRPGWAESLRMSASRLPFERLVSIDARMREAAARPGIVPEQVVIDHGKVFVSDTFARACERPGISIQPARKDYHSDLPLAATPTMRQLLTSGRLMIQLNRGQISARRGIILSGASGTGKTPWPAHRHVLAVTRR